MKIETGIPIPPRGSQGKPGTWAKMAMELTPEKSVFFEDGATGSKYTVRMLLSAMKRQKKKFVTRKVEEDGKKGVRVWCVK